MNNSVLPRKVSVSQLPHGLYLAKAPLTGIPGNHYSLLEIAGVLGASPTWAPTLVQLTPEGIIATPFSAEVALLAKVTDLRAARERYQEAVRDPMYRLFTNNCEHFARYVALGVRESEQAQWLGAALTAVGVIGVAALLRKSA